MTRQQRRSSAYDLGHVGGSCAQAALGHRCEELEEACAVVVVVDRALEVVGLEEAHDDLARGRNRRVLEFAAEQQVGLAKDVVLLQVHPWNLLRLVVGIECQREQHTAATHNVVQPLHWASLMHDHISLHTYVSSEYASSSLPSLIESLSLSLSLSRTWRKVCSLPPSRSTFHSAADGKFEKSK